MPGAVRIIGGRWRGRRLPVAPATDIRPTPDRVRETLFNWLQPHVAGARCLDLFAGTGVLGLEALSRGATDAWFVERDPRAAAALGRVLADLGGHGQVSRADALRWLRARPPQRFDIVFVDPPYGTLDLGNLCAMLDAGWLASSAWVYVETSRRDQLPDWPAGWQLHRDGTAGEVRFALARRDAA